MPQMRDMTIQSVPMSNNVCSALICVSFANFVCFYMRVIRQIDYLSGGTSFARAVQFNNNEASIYGGGIAVDGGDVT